jgi:hypothetical protein
MRCANNGKAVPSLFSEQQDAELLRVCAGFHALDAELDRLVACNHPPDQAFMALHAQWSQAVSQVIALPAHTTEGQQAKDRVLQAAMVVVLGS